MSLSSPGVRDSEVLCGRNADFFVGGRPTTCGGIWIRNDRKAEFWLNIMFIHIQQSGALRPHKGRLLFSAILQFL